MTSIVVLGIPWDANSSHRFGCAAGPAAIRAALHSGSGNDATEHGRPVVPELHDLGDLELLNERASTVDADTITAAIDQQLCAGHAVISLGGDHAITYPILRAVARHHDDLTVVHVDAHPDLYDDFEGNPLSHASPFARALEDGCMQRLVQLGIRTATQHSHDQAHRFGVEMIGARDLAGFDAGSLRGPIYLSIDLDGLDPAVAPGVSHHEPGGLTVREVLDVIDALPGPIVGADVVEYNPSRDLVDMTAMVGAKLLKEIAGRILTTGAG
ncbi:MAG: agmatinase [Ilumatobacter sp.]|nr:agmatinase [Ilumatobacter sp.]